MLGFGLDLAGYTTGNTSFAAVERKGDFAEATLFTNSVYSPKVKWQSGDQLSEVLGKEVETLRRCLQLGHVAVDAPIDLQDLGKPESAKRIWELTYRPIDKAFNALSPVADRIGAAVGRFRAIVIAGRFDALLGLSLFETYPEGTWKMLKLESKGYKNKSGKDIRDRLCSTCGISPQLGNDHDIDAVVCALTASASADEVCKQVDYTHRLSKLTGEHIYKIPKGYRLLKAFPRATGVKSEDFEAWMKRKESANRASRT